MNLHVTIVFAVIIAWNIAATNGGNLFLFIIYEDRQLERLYSYT